MKTVREVIADFISAPGLRGSSYTSADELLAALKEAGWVCVPVEPNHAMIHRRSLVTDKALSGDTYRAQWKAMVAASQDQGRE